ncbi:MAG: glycosyltransferase [Patescibacteria group bacterium]|nr:glycosyltransferase [Patescibacteria group bacterium]
MKVALVYDRINKWGGAERVLLALKELFPSAPLYTSVYNPLKAGWAKAFDIKTSFLQKFPGAPFNHEKFATFMPFAFESFSFDKFDLVVSVTSEAAKGIVTSPKTKHVCYCLTPTRYLWSGYDEYFKNGLLRLISRPAISYLRRWDKMASNRPDHFIAISKEVQKRIKKYYGRESKVIYPPLVLSAGIDSVGDSNLLATELPFGSIARSGSNMRSSRKFESPPSKFSLAMPRLKDQDYFLVVSRLVPYKRIDIAIKAFNKLKLPLKIIGTGSEEKRLKKMAKPNIEFLSNLTDEELLGYYKESSALIFPGIEDFGLVILEALSFGKPIIAFKGGGVLETVKRGKTGEFFYPQNEEALIRIIKNFKKESFSAKDCKDGVKKFERDRFRREFMDFVNEIM